MFIVVDRCGEEYYLQIDSHIRFRPNWDTYLVDLHHECMSIVHESNRNNNNKTDDDVDYTEAVISSKFHQT